MANLVSAAPTKLLPGAQLECPFLGQRKVAKDAPDRQPCPSMNLRGTSILLLEDEVALARRLAGLLERAGAEVTVTATLAEARRVLAAMQFDAALLDINLPDGRSLELLRRREIPSHLPVLVMTAEPGVESAVEAIKLGAADYLSKPIVPEELALRIARARRQNQSARREEHQRQAAGATGTDFIFTPALGPLQQQLERIVAADTRLVQGPPSPVLIEGETGTGKTSLARWIHHHGPRAAGPLIEVNCAAIPENLVESELFGHERGAFTDAKEARIGLLEAAEGGTLFLDELPSLSLGCQAKLLKAIEDHSLRRVGGTRDVPIDARIVAASAVDLRTRVTEGRFRDDLLHRLDVFRLRIPPLRERGDDVLLLAQAIVTRVGQRYGLSAAAIPEEGQDVLRRYWWPGNVRELAHEIERSLVFEDSGLTFPSLRTALPASGPSAAPVGWLADFRVPDQGFSLEHTIDYLVTQALAQTNGNVSAAARLLGVPRDYVRYRLKTNGAPPSPERE
jgi:two-component system, NtrC family, response regulator AtoC